MSKLIRIKIFFISKSNQNRLNLPVLNHFYKLNNSKGQNKNFTLKQEN